MKKIGIVGLWHLGIVLVSSWAKLGNKVVGFDHDINLVNNLKQFKPPLYEPGVVEILKEHSDNITFSNDMNSLSDCDFVFLSYDTPVNPMDYSNTKVIVDAILILKEHLKNDAIVIVSSQSPVGLCSRLRNSLRAHNSTLDLVYSPENLRLGEAIECYLHPERIILGVASENTKEKCLELLGQLGSDVMTMSLESAEMVKHGINSFLAMSIVFTDQLSDICSHNGANILDVVKGIKSDERIGKKAYMAPGVGFSGGTLGRDLRVLQREFELNGEYSNFFENIYNINYNRKHSIISKIQHHFGKLKGKTIGILGLTYKPGTSTLRRSLPIEMINTLSYKGVNIIAYDPMADYSELEEPRKFEIAHSIEEVIRRSDVTVIMTPWDEFKNFDYNSMGNIQLFDARLCADKNKVNKVIYKTI